MPAITRFKNPEDPDYDQSMPVSEFKDEQVKWILPGWIPSGKISVIFGEPGVGKSHVTLDIAARLTTGRPMPLCEASSEPLNVLLFSAEDSVGDTIKPRLEAAAADCTRVRALPLGGRNVFADPMRVLSLIATHRASLIIVDPLSAYAGRHDIQRDQHMRRLLTPLAQVAATTRAAVLLVHHVNKGVRGSALMRSAGSIGITAVARSVMMVGKDPEDPESRILAHVKCNLTSTPPAIRFHFDQAEGANHSRIQWDGLVKDLAADSLLNRRPQHIGSHSSSPQALVERFLRETLAQGPMPSRELEELAEERGISRSTFKRAKLAITTCSRTGGLGSNGEWQTELLPTCAA